MKPNRLKTWIAGSVISSLCCAAMLGSAHAQNNVTWSTGSGAWDTTTANWTGDSTTYSDGDHATFNDTGSGGTITVQGGGLTPGSTTVAGTKAYTFGGGSILDGSLAKSGAGVLTLTAANVFNGASLSGGQVWIDGNNRLGTGTVTFVDDTIVVYDTAASAGTFANGIHIADGKTGTFDIDHGGGTWLINGLVTGGSAGNPVTLVLREQNLGGGSFDDARLGNTGNSFVGTLILRDRLEFQWNGQDGVFGNPSNTITMLGAHPRMDLNGHTLHRNVSGGQFKDGTLAGKMSGSIEILGSSTVILTNPGNTNLAGVSVGGNSSHGIVRVGDPAALGDAGSSLKFGGNIGTLSITGTPTTPFEQQMFIENNDPVGSSFVSILRVENGNASIDWTGDVYTRQSGDNDNLAKAGAGALNLYDFNVSGTLAIRVDAGTLNVNDPGAGVFADLTVKSGATLGGTGTLAMAPGAVVNYQDGSTATPGMSAGTLTVSGGIVDINGAFTYMFEIGETTNDVLAAADLNFDDLTNGVLSVTALGDHPAVVVGPSDQLAVFTYSGSVSSFDANDWTIVVDETVRDEGAVLVDDGGGTIHVQGLSNIPPPTGTIIAIM